jgi:protein TonB
MHVNLMPLSQGPGTPAWTRPPGHVRHALAFSTVAHVAALGVLMWIAHAGTVRPSQEAAQKAKPAPLIWISIPGPTGGGGGRQAPTPPQPRPEPPQAARTLDVPAPPPMMIASEETPLREPAEPQPPVLVNMAEAAMAGAASAPVVTGGGSGPGQDRGTGGGAGPGTDRGFGDGAYRPGNGVTPPVPVRRASPQYTVEAMRARAQGIIIVECVVEPNGECGDVRIVRGFTPPYGLDRQAVDAARRWHFRPGTRGGEAVPVLVSFEIAFNIH